VELWTLTYSDPHHARKAAVRAEAAGWHGLAVVDSQNLAPDSYVALTVAALATTRLGLGTGVTNSATRHAAVTASAAAALQRVSGGRMVLGIGRGDSALAHLGRAPARLAGFERYVRCLAAYLSGEEVPFEDLPLDDAIAPPVEVLGLADHPSASRIAWLGRGEPRVPIEVAATGPRVIAIAARHTDRVMFTLGAQLERLRWGIALARAARADAAIGAYVNLVCHPDRAVARALVRGGLTTFARFSVMHGDAQGPLSKQDSETLGRLHAGYDMKQHTRADSRQADLLPDEFVDRFAIAGPPDYCIERLHELAELGLEKVIVSGPTAGADPVEARRAAALLDEAVVPAFASSPATPAPSVDEG
jgi:5,10-methylenetetrahydromethanopterin reductase